MKSHYQLAVQQVEAEFWAEIQEARTVRECKLRALEQLRPVFEKIFVDMATPEPSAPGHAHHYNVFTPLIRQKLSLFKDDQDITGSAVWDAVLSKHSAVFGDGVNRRGLVDTILRQEAKKGALSVMDRPKGVRPYVYRRKLSLVPSQDMV